MFTETLRLSGDFILCRGCAGWGFELNSGGEFFELLAMLFIAGVVSGDFGPKSGGMIEVIKMGELMEDDIVAKRLGDLHEADIEGDGAIR